MHQPCRSLAELASKVLQSLGSYNYLTNNCQTFVDKFLKQLNTGGYKTDTKFFIDIGSWISIIGGVVVAVVAIIKFIA